VGKVTAHVPKCGLAIMQTSMPEVMCTEDVADDCITSYQLTDACTALCIGPGIGRNEATAVMLENVLKHATRPCVFDADALNLIATHQWLTLLPEHSIITPHVGEFDRLFGVHENNFARLRTQMKQSQELQLTILMKGAHSVITTPEGEVFFNSTGNPGMATAGSGDVLSGIIGALLAQGYACGVAARLGAFIHGLAGNAAEELRGSDAMIARDMIEFIGDAFMQIHDLRDLIV
jgi:NAD(P)H-hydrate epimerase